MKISLIISLVNSVSENDALFRCLHLRFGQIDEIMMQPFREFLLTTRGDRTIEIYTLSRCLSVSGINVFHFQQVGTGTLIILLLYDCFINCS